MGEKLLGGIKKAGAAGKKIANAIRKIIKAIKVIITTPLKWLALILLVIVLLYILVQTIAKAIRDVFGIEEPGIKDTADYQILMELRDSGYNELMPNDELQKYMNYEYGVLMDAARFFSETGVVEKKHVDTENAVDISQIALLEDGNELLAELFELSTMGTDRPEYKEFVSEVSQRIKAEEDKRELEEKKSYAEEKIKEWEEVKTELETARSNSLRSREGQEAYENKLLQLGQQFGLKNTDELYTHDDIVTAIEAKVQATSNAELKAQYLSSKTELETARSNSTRSEEGQAAYKTKLKEVGSQFLPEYMHDSISTKVQDRVQQAREDIQRAEDAYSRLQTAKESDNVSEEDLEKLSTELKEALNKLARRYGPDELTNTHSSVDLFYKVVKNESFVSAEAPDGQESLVPYLRIFRRATRYTYHYLVPEGSDIRNWIEGKNNDELALFTEDFYNPSVDISSGDYRFGAIDASDLFTQMSTYKINSSLNGRNKDLWRGSPAPGGGGPLSTKDIYGRDEDFIEVGDIGSATYEIPFKVLVNKYLPKAQLLSSWYMLKDSSDDGTVKKLLDEIQAIYNYYCLYGEKEGEETARDLIVKYAEALRIRLVDKDTQELLLDPENHVDTREIDRRIFDQKLISNLVSFVVFERIELGFYTGGKIEFSKSKYRAITDLMQAGQFDINFDINYKYSYNNVKMKEDFSFETEGDRQHASGTISGEEARAIFSSELEKILNGSEPITIKGGDAGDTTVYIHGLSGMGIHSEENRPEEILPLKFCRFKVR